MRLPTFCLAGALSLAVAAVPPAHAAHFDLIYVDHFDVTLCTGCGITLAGTDFALVVNEGAAAIPKADFFAGAFSAVSSEPTLELLPFVNYPGTLFGGDILPQEAVGSVSQYDNDIVLLSRLQPGETLRNTTPLQVLAFEILRNTGTYEGPVRFDVTFVMGGEQVEFSMFANVLLGPHAIEFTSAARTSSIPLPVPAVHASWGAIKRLYR